MDSAGSSMTPSASCTGARKLRTTLIIICTVRRKEGKKEKEKAAYRPVLKWCNIPYVTQWEKLTAGGACSADNPLRL